MYGSDADVTRGDRNNSCSCDNSRSQRALCISDVCVGGSSQDASIAGVMEDSMNVDSKVIIEDCR